MSSPRYHRPTHLATRLPSHIRIFEPELAGQPRIFEGSDVSPEVLPERVCQSACAGVGPGERRPSPPLNLPPVHGAAACRSSQRPLAPPAPLASVAPPLARTHKLPHGIAHGLVQGRCARPQTHTPHWRDVSRETLCLIGDQARDASSGVPTTVPFDDRRARHGASLTNPGSSGNDARSNTSCADSHSLPSDLPAAMSPASMRSATTAMFWGGPQAPAFGRKGNDRVPPETGRRQAPMGGGLSPVTSRPVVGRQGSGRSDTGILLDNRARVRTSSDRSASLR